MKVLKRVVVSFVTLNSLVLSGCMSVNNQLVSRDTVTPPAQPPVVELKQGDFIQTLNDEGDHRGVLSNSTVWGSVATIAMNRWKSQHYISQFGTAGRLSVKPLYTVTISGKRNEDSSIAGAIFCGLTFFILPTSSTLTYDLTYDVENNVTHKHYTTQAKNSVTIYQELLLLPATPFALNGVTSTINDIADHAYDELRQQGAFGR